MKTTKHVFSYSPLILPLELALNLPLALVQLALPIAKLVVQRRRRRRRRMGRPNDTTPATVRIRNAFAATAPVAFPVPLAVPLPVVQIPVLVLVMVMMLPRASAAVQVVMLVVLAQELPRRWQRVNTVRRRVGRVKRLKGGIVSIWGIEGLGGWGILTWVGLAFSLGKLMLVCCSWSVDGLHGVGGKRRPWPWRRVTNTG